jgi:hypothetical protein
MKKLIFCGILILYAVAVSGQAPDTTGPSNKTEKRQHTSVGLYLGANNINNLYIGPGSNNSRYNLSAVFGGYGLFDLGPKLQLEVGLGWMGSGGKYFKFGNFEMHHDTTIHNDNILTSVDYITVPVCIKYKWTPKSLLLGGFRWAQITNGYMYTSNWAEKNKYILAENNYLSALPDNLNRTDICLMLGYEYHFTERIYASAIINFGFLPLFNADARNFWINQLDNGFFDPVQYGNYNRSLIVRICYNAW